MSADPSKTIVIIGGGQAGAIAANTLRDGGFEGRIILICAEPHLPYERPPLSKEVITQPGTARVTIFGEDYYSEKRIDLRLGVRAQSIDPVRRHVHLPSGEVLSYDKLLLATGARARPYPLLDQLREHVFTIRTLEDALRLRDRLESAKSLLIVGGGIIGLEVASSATACGAHVTIIERGPRLMSRAAPEPLAQILFELHRANGVDFVFDAVITNARRREDGRLEVTLDDMRQYTADAIVYGIGVTLNDELARTAGLLADDGILVDDYGRTSNPDIYAAGDVARAWDARLGAYAARQETWQNANLQAARAAKAMLNQPLPDSDSPWYWTDQFGVNIQVTGRTHADNWLWRGDRNGPSYTALGVTGGVIVSAFTVNNGREMRPLRKIIQTARPCDLDWVCNPANDLRKVTFA